MIAKVEPLTQARALRGPFDYRVAEVDGVGIGSLLLVPFGGRRLLGVVTGLAETSEVADERLAAPLDLIEPGTTPELVQLGLWVAREYCSTPARGLALALPPGTGTGAGGRRVGAATETIVRLASSAQGTEPRLGAKQRAVLAALADGELSMRNLSARTGADRATVRRLESRGLVATESARRRRVVAVPAVGTAPRAVVHTPAQAEAIKAAIAALPGRKAGEGTGRELLLHGVTGSGKTEVYLSVAAEALRRGRSVIAMVPEIGLTPQNLTRFRARLGERVAVLHSGMSAGERFDEWDRLRSGEATVCVGPRSAIFAPVRDLGLVIVDEEHDASYKQDSDPRYDAREVARRRAHDAGALLIAGTATPRPESWHAMERIGLAERADGTPLPDVGVIDMRGVPGLSGPLHEACRRELAEHCRAGGKAIVLLNRRGWSPHMECRGCGRAWRCENCDVSLVLHRGSPPRLRCHHCGASEPAPRECPDCGSVSISRHGVGTERLAEYVGELVAPHPVFRLDADTAGRAGHAEVLAAFEAATGGVLVGTQMLAKGHDFAGVGVGIVVDADATLRFPDFRSEERTFALVTQLAGRIGRGGGSAGRVLVQTLDPGSDAISFAARHDAAGFLTRELARREALGYPPFTHLARVEIGAETDAAAMRSAEGLADRIRPGLPGGVSLLGPAPRFRVRGRSRAHLVAKGRERIDVVEPLRDAVEQATAKGLFKGLTVAVDVDPQQ